jgi:hypothetical protein
VAAGRTYPVAVAAGQVAPADGRDSATPQPLGWPLGLIWAPPCGGNREIGWHGFQLIVGNAYVLTGLALFVLLLAVALATYRNSRAKDLGPAP